ncbi:MAG: hypothetical protein NC928_04395 [Candidatus Omnitrophica bacterium]|nr:hypothetical protein [Candidatus Omnitrophota bacterium]
MNKWHKTITKEKWAGFSLKEQILMIGSEILRAKNWLEHKDIETTLICYERAMELIDLTVTQGDLSLKIRKLLLQLREAIGFLYLKESGDPSLCQIFYNELISLVS